MLGTIITYGSGGMETIRDMRVELLHPDLYATPTTEIELIIDCTAKVRFRLLE